MFPNGVPYGYVGRGVDSGAESAPARGATDAPIQSSADGGPMFANGVPPTATSARGVDSGWLGSRPRAAYAHRPGSGDPRFGRTAAAATQLVPDAPPAVVATAPAGAEGFDRDDVAIGSGSRIDPGDGGRDRPRGDPNAPAWRIPEAGTQEAERPVSAGRSACGRLRTCPGSPSRSGFPRPSVMGVVNVTPGLLLRRRRQRSSRRRDRVRSTHGRGGRRDRGRRRRVDPAGLRGVTLDEELRRVLPVLEALGRELPLSIDTAKAEVAAARSSSARSSSTTSRRCAAIPSSPASSPTRTPTSA